MGAGPQLNARIDPRVKEWLDQFPHRVGPEGTKFAKELLDRIFALCASGAEFPAWPLEIDIALRLKSGRIATTEQPRLAAEPAAKYFRRKPETKADDQKAAGEGAA